jgi:hypothetical protein
MVRPSIGHICRRPRRAKTKPLMALEAEGLLTMARATTGSVLLCCNRVGTLPIARVDVPRSQSPIVAGLTLPKCVATLAATRLIACDVSMTEQPVVAVLQRGRHMTGLQQLPLESGFHPSAHRFMADRTLSARVAIEPPAACMTVSAGRLSGQALGTRCIGQPRDPQVTLSTSNVAPGVTRVRVPKVRDGMWARQLQMALLATRVRKELVSTHLAVVHLVTTVAGRGSRSEPILGANARFCLGVTVHAGQFGFLGVQTMRGSNLGTIGGDHDRMRPRRRCWGREGQASQCFGPWRLKRCHGRKKCSHQPRQPPRYAPRTFHGHLAARVAMIRKRWAAPSIITCSHSAPNSGRPPGYRRSPATYMKLDCPC